MNAFVTGGAGCIGSDLAEALVARGDHVTVYDNLSSGKLEHLTALQHKPNFRFIQGDLSDFSCVQQALKGADMVYHLAANPDVKFTEGEATDKDLQQNTLCTYNVLEAVRCGGIRKIAFSSTSAIYGVVENLPIPEEGLFPRPISLYGATKLSCEALISSFQHLFGIQAWVFRFANVVGAKVRKKGGTVVGDFIGRLMADPTRLRILGDGKQAKSYLLSTECVEAMLYVVDRADDPLNVYNLGCTDWLPVKDIADMVVEAMGLRGVMYEYTGGEGGWPGDVPRFLLDVSRVNRLGWRARHNSAEAVDLAIRSTMQRMGIAPAEAW